MHSFMLKESLAFYFAPPTPPNKQQQSQPGRGLQFTYFEILSNLMQGGLGVALEWLEDTWFVLYSGP